MLIKEEGLPPRSWGSSRITEIHQGKDNVVRTVSLKMILGVLTFVNYFKACGILDLITQCELVLNVRIFRLLEAE